MMRFVILSSIISCVFSGLFDLDTNDDVNLLTAVGSPLPPDVRPVTGPFGARGRPAVEFTPQSYVGRWARDLLPMPFYYDFGMKVTLYLQSINGGVLFSILESDHSRLKLGLSVLKVGKNKQRIELVYLNDHRNGKTKQLTATFVLPKFVKTWTVFSLTIRKEVVTIFFNGCHKIYSKVFQEKRLPLHVNPTDPVFVGMAGWYIDKPSFFGAIYDLTIYRDVNKAVPLCVKKKQAEYELVNFQENTNAQRHEEDKVGDGASEEDETTAKIIKGLNRIESNDNNVPSGKDPSSGKKQGGSLVNPFKNNDDSSSTHETGSDGAEFNPFADDIDESPDTRTMRTTPTTPIKPTAEPDNASTEALEEEFNPFADFSDDDDDFSENSDDTNDNSGDANDVSSDPNDVSSDHKDVSSEHIDSSNNDVSGDNNGHSRNIKEVNITKQDVNYNSKEVNNNHNDTQKSGVLFDPENYIGTLDNSGKPEDLQRNNKITTKSPSSTLSTSTSTSSTISNVNNINNGDLPVPTTAAQVLTKEYGENLHEDTTVPTKQNEVKTDSAHVTSANTTKRRSSSTENINKTKMKNNRTMAMETDGNMQIPTTSSKIVDEQSPSYTTSSPLVNESSIKNVTDSYLPSKNVEPVTTADTTQANVDKTIIENSLKKSLHKTLIEKLTKLMDTQRSSTTTPENMATVALPTQQIMTLAKTVSHRKFKELLPKILYNRTRNLHTTTSLPESVLTTILPSTTKIAELNINHIEDYYIEEKNRITLNELALKDTVAPKTYTFQVHDKIETKNSPTPAKVTTRLNNESTNNNVANKVDTETSQSTRSPMKHDDTLVMQDANQRTEISDSVYQDTVLTQPPPEVDLSSNADPTTTRLNSTPSITTKVTTTTMTSREVERPDTTKDMPKSVRKNVNGERGENGVDERPRYEGVTVDDITRHVIEKLKSNKRENEDLINEEKIRQVTIQVLEELKVSGKLYEPDGSASQVVYLKGEKGDKGESAIKGTQGRTGLPGVIGLRGPPGPPGPSGDHGIDGNDGRPGLTGLKGLRGEKGDRGLPRGIPSLSPGIPRKQDIGYETHENTNENNKENKERKLRGMGIKSGPGSSMGANALIIYTMQDLFMMTAMFPIGSFVFVTSTSELYVRGINGWIQIPTVLVSDSAAGYLSSPIAHKIQAQAKPSPPLPIDEKLLKDYLELPKPGTYCPRPYLLMVALNEPFNGETAGTIGADYMCMKEANAIGLDGTTFRAFLSSDYVAIKYLVHKSYNNLPIANFKGEMLFTSINTIFNETGYAAFNPEIPIISFDVRDVRLDHNWPVKKIWHGSHASGEANHKGLNCKNWRTSSSESSGTAASIMTYTPALNEEVVRCSSELIVLCLQSKLVS